MPRDDQLYIVDLCDRVLRQKAIREHRFDFLLGDPGKDGKRRKLPVDAYYPELRLVLEYRERQHVEAIPIMDRRMTISGVSRAEQRRIYDQRRRDELASRGIRLLELEFSDFSHDRKKRLRCDLRADERIIRERLVALGIEPPASS